MSQPTDASDTDLPEEEGLKWTVESGSGNKTEYHPRRESFAAPPPSDAERAEVEALNARVAQLTEALASTWPGIKAGKPWQQAMGGNVSRCHDLANAALAGTGTDWLEAHDAQVRADVLAQLNDRSTTLSESVVRAYSGWPLPNEAARVLLTKQKEMRDASKALMLKAAPIAAAFRSETSSVEAHEYDGFLTALADLSRAIGSADAPGVESTKEA